LIVAAGPTAGAAWDQFAHGEGYRSSTRRQYGTVTTRFLDWLNAEGFGLAQVTPETVQHFICHPEWGPRTRSQYRTALRCFFDTLCAHDVVAANPADAAAIEDEQPAEGPSTGNSERTKRLPTLDELKGYVRELALDPIEEGDEDFEGALVLLAGLYLGSSKIMPLSRLTKVPQRVVAEYARNLRANGIWTPDGKTSTSWFDEGGGQLAFWMDVWVGQGLFVRGRAEEASGDMKGNELPKTEPDARGDMR
jgi:hypothetical protein